MEFLIKNKKKICTIFIFIIIIVLIAFIISMIYRKLYNSYNKNIENLLDRYVGSYELYEHSYQVKDFDELIQYIEKLNKKSIHKVKLQICNETQTESLTFGEENDNSDITEYITTEEFENLRNKIKKYFNTSKKFDNFNENCLSADLEYKHGYIDTIKIYFGTPDMNVNNVLLTYKGEQTGSNIISLFNKITDTEVKTLKFYGDDEEICIDNISDNNYKDEVSEKITNIRTNIKSQNNKNQKYYVNFIYDDTGYISEIDIYTDKQKYNDNLSNGLNVYKKYYYQIIDEKNT